MNLFENWYFLKSLALVFHPWFFLWMAAYHSALCRSARRGPRCRLHNCTLTFWQFPAPCKAASRAFASCHLLTDHNTSQIQNRLFLDQDSIASYLPRECFLALYLGAQYSINAYSLIPLGLSKLFGHSPSPWTFLILGCGHRARRPADTLKLYNNVLCPPQFRVLS